MKVSSLKSLFCDGPLFRKKMEEFKPIKTLVVMPNPHSFAGTNVNEQGPFNTYQVNEYRMHERRVDARQAEKNLYKKIAFKRRRRIELALESLRKIRERKDIELQLAKHDAAVAERNRKIMQDRLEVIEQNREAAKTVAAKAEEARLVIQEVIKEIEAEIQVRRDELQVAIGKKYDYAKFVKAGLEHDKLTLERHLEKVDQQIWESLEKLRMAAANERERKYQFRKFVMAQSLSRRSHRRHVTDASWQRREYETYVFGKSKDILNQRDFVDAKMKERMQVRRDIASPFVVQLFGPAKSLVERLDRQADGKSRGLDESDLLMVRAKLEPPPENTFLVQTKIQSEEYAGRAQRETRIFLDQLDVRRALKSQTAARDAYYKKTDRLLAKSRIKQDEKEWSSVIQKNLSEENRVAATVEEKDVEQTKELSHAVEEANLEARNTDSIPGLSSRKSSFKKSA